MKNQYIGSRNPKNITWTGNASFGSEQELYNNVTYKFEEIVDSIELNIHRNSKKRLTLRNKIYLKKNEDWKSSIQENRHRKYGKCYSFVPEHEILESGVYYIHLKL